MSPLRNALSSAGLKRTLYASGALDAWHRRRNRDHLTVIVLHRVLPTDDPRWSTSDPEYTISEDLFAACLRFFKRHYNVVALDDVLAARAGERPLPERPLLITFDDGWSDNEEFALRQLRDAGLPALLFVVSDAVGRNQPFWQEQMITAWRSGRLDATGAVDVWRQVSAAAVPAFATTSLDQLDPVRELIAAIEKVDASTRTRVLAGLAAVLDDGVRYMITPEQLRHLAASRVAIGAHGQTHAPLTQVPDADAELTTARRELERLLGRSEVNTLSFPHGRFDDALLDRAFAAGYQLLFHGVTELPPAGADGPGALGRIGFTQATVTDRHGNFAPELLALHLFRRPHAARG